MNLDLSELLTWAPAFALVLARVGATMALLPGLGETVVPAMVRVAIAMCIRLDIYTVIRDIVNIIVCYSIVWRVPYNSYATKTDHHIHIYMIDLVVDNHVVLCRTAAITDDPNSRFAVSR